MEPRRAWLIAGTHFVCVSVIWKQRKRRKATRSGRTKYFWLFPGNAGGKGAYFSRLRSPASCRPIWFVLNDITVPNITFPLLSATLWVLFRLVAPLNNRFRNLNNTQPWPPSFFHKRWQMYRHPHSWLEHPLRPSSYLCCVQLSTWGSRGKTSSQTTADVSNSPHWQTVPLLLWPPPALQSLHFSPLCVTPQMIQ